MSDNQQLVFRAEAVDWWQPPGHSGALSKLLVNPEKQGSKHFDFRVSHYAPSGFVEPHIHADGEHVYYILSGSAVMELDGVRHLVERHTCIFIPAGVSHGISNTGFQELVFIVVSSPPSILPREVSSL